MKKNIKLLYGFEDLVKFNSTILIFNIFYKKTRKILFTWFLLFTCLSFTFGQAPADSIIMKKGFGGYMFFQNNKRLNMSQLVKSMQINEQAYKDIQSAKKNYVLATVFGGVGGFMVGWPIGTALGGGEPNWVMAGVGAGLVAVSIPISIKFNKQAKVAVDEFNGGLQKSAFLEKTKLGLAYTGNGIGLILKF